MDRQSRSPSTQAFSTSPMRKISPVKPCQLDLAASVRVMLYFFSRMRSSKSRVWWTVWARSDGCAGGRRRGSRAERSEKGRGRSCEMNSDWTA